jgi:K+ transporter
VPCSTATRWITSALSVLSAVEGIKLVTESRSANDAADYFQIPSRRVVEVGTQVSI